MHDNFTAFEDGEAVPATTHTPLDDLIQGEGGAVPGSAAWSARREIFAKLLAFFFADGAQPLTVVKRVFAVAWSLDFNGLKRRHTQADLARMFGETRAAHSKRVKVVVSDFLQQRGAKGAYVPGQKSSAAVAKFRQLQRDNNNRRGGKRQI